MKAIKVEEVIELAKYWAKCSIDMNTSVESRTRYEEKALVIVAMLTNVELDRRFPIIEVFEDNEKYSLAFEEIYDKYYYQIFKD